MALYELVRLYRKSVYECADNKVQQAQLDDCLNKIYTHARTSGIVLPDEPVLGRPCSGILQIYIETKKVYNDVKTSYEKLVAITKECFEQIQTEHYTIDREDTDFRGIYWESSYRGFSGVPCPSCGMLNTFKDGKCQRDGTEQYIDLCEISCARDSFAYGVRPGSMLAGYYGNPFSGIRATAGTCHVDS